MFFHSRSRSREFLGMIASDSHSRIVAMSLFYNVINKFGHIWYLCKGYLWTPPAVWGCFETCLAQCTDIMCTGGEGKGAMARRRARGLLMMKNTKYKIQNTKCKMQNTKYKMLWATARQRARGLLTFYEEWKIWTTKSITQNTRIKILNTNTNTKCKIQNAAARQRARGLLTFYDPTNGPDAHCQHWLAENMNTHNIWQGWCLVGWSGPWFLIKVVNICLLCLCQFDFNRNIVNSHGPI